MVTHETLDVNASLNELIEYNYLIIRLNLPTVLRLPSTSTYIFNDILPVFLTFTRLCLRFYSYACVLCTILYVCTRNTYPITRYLKGELAKSIRLNLFRKRFRSLLEISGENEFISYRTCVTVFFKNRQVKVPKYSYKRK